VTEHFPHAVEDLLGFLADFRPDTVPGQYDDVEVHELKAPEFKGFLLSDG
jgi:hypothetical protein